MSLILKAKRVSQKAIVFSTAVIFFFNMVLIDSYAAEPTLSFKKSTLRPASAAKTGRVEAGLKSRLAEFICENENCGMKVRPLERGRRDHCPHCLWTAHTDGQRPGDRALECHGEMEPIGAEYHPKRGWVISYRCRECGAVKKSKAAPDDNWDMIISLSQPDRQGIRAAVFGPIGAKQAEAMDTPTAGTKPAARKTAVISGRRKRPSDTQSASRPVQFPGGEEKLNLQDVIAIIRDSPRGFRFALAHICRFKPEEAVKTMIDLALRAEEPGLFDRYMCAVHYRLGDIEAWPPDVDFSSIESKILDCLEYGVMSLGPRRPIYSVLRVLKRFSSCKRAGFESAKENERALDALLEIVEDMPDDTDSAGYNRISLCLECIARILSRLNKQTLPPSVKGRILNMLNDTAYIVSYNTKMRLLLALEYILEIEASGTKDTQAQALDDIPDLSGGRSVIQLDRAADVMVELQDSWSRDKDKKPFDKAVDEMINSIRQDERLTPRQKMRFYMGLIHLKTDYLILNYHIRKLGKDSADECDPVELLKNITGVQLPPGVRVSVIYDSLTPFNIYFEFENKKKYLLFERLYDERIIMWDTSGNYKYNIVASFGYKNNGERIRKHETEHAFYRAVAEMIREKYGFCGRENRVDFLETSFLEHLRKGEYEKAGVFIGKITKELITDFKNELLAFLVGEDWLSQYFEDYRDKFCVWPTTVRGKRIMVGIIPRIRMSIDAIQDAENKKQLQDYLDQELKKAEEAIMEYEAASFRLLSSVGREKGLALLHILPLNRYNCIGSLCGYYRPISLEKTDQCLDKIDGIIEEFKEADRQTRLLEEQLKPIESERDSLLSERGKVIVSSDEEAFTDLTAAFTGKLSPQSYERLLDLNEQAIGLRGQIKEISSRSGKIARQMVHNLFSAFMNIATANDSGVSDGPLDTFLEGLLELKDSRLQGQLDRIIRQLKAMKGLSFELTIDTRDKGLKDTSFIGLILRALNELDVDSTAGIKTAANAAGDLTALYTQTRVELVSSKLKSSSSGEKQNRGLKRLEKIITDGIRDYLRTAEIVLKILSSCKKHKDLEALADSPEEDISHCAKYAISFNSAVRDLAYWLCGGDAESVGPPDRPQLDISSHAEWSYINDIIDIFETAMPVTDVLFTTHDKLSLCYEEELYTLTAQVFDWILKNNAPVLQEEIKGIKIEEFAGYFSAGPEERKDEFKKVYTLIKQKKSIEEARPLIEAVDRAIAMLEGLRCSEPAITEEFKTLRSEVIMVFPEGQWIEAERTLKEAEERAKAMIEEEKAGEKTVFRLLDLHEKMKGLGLPAVTEIMEEVERYFQEHKRSILALIEERLQERCSLCREGKIEGLKPLLSNEALIYLREHFLPNAEAEAKKALAEGDLSGFIKARDKISTPEADVVSQLRNKGKWMNKTEWVTLQENVLKGLDRRAAKVFADHQGLKRLREAEGNPQQLFMVEILGRRAEVKPGDRWATEYYEVDCEGAPGRVDISEAPRAPDTGNRYYAMLVECNWEGDIFRIPRPVFSIRKARNATPPALIEAINQKEPVKIQIMDVVCGSDGEPCGAKVICIDRPETEGADYFIYIAELPCFIREDIGSFVGGEFYAIPKFESGPDGKERLTFLIQDEREEPYKHAWQRLEEAGGENGWVTVTIAGIATHGYGAISGLEVFLGPVKCNIVKADINDEQMRDYIYNGDEIALKKYIGTEIQARVIRSITPRMYPKIKPALSMCAPDEPRYVPRMDRRQTEDKTAVRRPSSEPFRGHTPPKLRLRKDHGASFGWSGVSSAQGRSKTSGRSEAQKIIDKKTRDQKRQEEEAAKVDRALRKKQKRWGKAVEDFEAIQAAKQAQALQMIDSSG